MVGETMRGQWRVRVCSVDLICRIGALRADGSLGLCYRKVAGVLGAVGGSGNLFWRLFGGEEPRMPGTGCFWLDSAAADR